VTPLATALTGHGPGMTSLDMSEGVTFLLGVPLRGTESMTTAMSMTPSRLGLRHSPILLSSGGAVPDHFSPLVFRAAIRVAPYPRHFRPSTHISKYDGETNPYHWLEDYHLAMKAGGSDDNFTIQYLLYSCQAQPEFGSSSSSPAASAVGAISMRSSSATSRVPTPA
jgi:hypothetical protein